MNKLLTLVLVLVFIQGCSNRADVSDLDMAMKTARETVSTTIDPLPTYPPSEKFIYSAMALRSPFERPIELAEADGQVRGVKVDAPNENRVKEPLEQYDISTLQMVGAIKMSGGLEALIATPDKKVMRVDVGNYLGRNHGRVLSIQEDIIELEEIVPDGREGWIKRPRAITLKSLQDN